MTDVFQPESITVPYSSLKPYSIDIFDPFLSPEFLTLSTKAELADLYFTYGRYDEALFEYNKVIALNPENLEVRLKVAKVYAKKGFTSKAIDELRRLKNEEPNFVHARIALGVIYYGNGKIIEAQTEWRKVLSKDPRNTEASMYLNLSRTATETSVSLNH